MKKYTVRAIGHWEEIEVIGQRKNIDGLRVPLLQLDQKELIGVGGFSSIYRVVERSKKIEYALKIMEKKNIQHCLSHFKQEQNITRNNLHPFCLRQYASCEDDQNYYLLFDYLPGGDIMDILLAEKNKRKAKRTMSRSIPFSYVKAKRQHRGLREKHARFYLA